MAKSAESNNKREGDPNAKIAGKLRQRMEKLMSGERHSSNSNHHNQESGNTHQEEHHNHEETHHGEQHDDHNHSHEPWTMKTLGGISKAIGGVLGAVGVPHGKVHEIQSKLPWMESGEFTQVGRYLIEDHMNHSLVEMTISDTGHAPVLKHSVKKSTNIEIEYEGKEKKVIKEEIRNFPLDKNVPIVIDFCDLEVEGQTGKTKGNKTIDFRHDVRVKGKIMIKVNDIVAFHRLVDGQKGALAEILQEERGRLVKAVEGIIGDNDNPQIPDAKRIKTSLYGGENIKYRNYPEGHGQTIFSYAVGFSDVDWTEETKRLMSSHEGISNLVYLEKELKAQGASDAVIGKAFDAVGLGSINNNNKQVEINKLNK